MQNWTLTFFQDDIDCDMCSGTIFTGYIAGQHIGYGDRWMCLSCICAVIRRAQRETAPRA